LRSHSYHNISTCNITRSTLEKTMNFVVSIIALTGLLCCIAVAEGQLYGSGYNYTSIGCFADKKRPARAIASLEGTSELLDGRFKRRQNATAKCAALAYSLNFTIFAVARGGECLGDGQSNDTVGMHGPSDNCQPDGEGGRFPAAMEVYEITTACQELEVNCYGDCCNQTWSHTEMRCPGYWDSNSQCQMGPDYCMPLEMNNTRYAKSLGAPEVCPMSCGYQCNYPEEMNCWSNGNGCGYSYCQYIGNNNNNFTGQGTAARQLLFSNDSCPISCPAICSQYDLVCSNGNDANGCSYGEHCTPIATDSWDGSECPGVCYTPCDHNAGEVYCPIESQNHCYAGNYCEMPDADGNACQGTAMRVDPEDELMLRSGSPDSVAAFYKKLTDMARK